MHRTRTALAAVGVAATAVAAVGCGSEQAGTTALHGSPHQQVLTSFENLTKGDTLSGTLHLGTDAASLLRFGARVGGGNLDGKQAQALAGGAVRFTVHSTQGSLADLAGQQSPSNTEQFDLAFTDQGRRYAELRVVDSNLYLQANVKGIMALVGAPRDAYAHALALAGKAPASIKQVAVAVLTGKWVELPASQLKALQNKIRAQAGPNAAPSPNPQQRQRFLTSLQNLFRKDVKVKQTRSTTGGGSYALTANTRQLVGSFLTSLAQLQPALAGQVHGMPLSRVPSRTITFGAQVSNARLSRLSFDLAQLVPKRGTPHLPLDLDFSTASMSVTAPSGAVHANLTALFQTLTRSAIQHSSGTAAVSHAALVAG